MHIVHSLLQESKLQGKHYVVSASTSQVDLPILNELLDMPNVCTSHATQMSPSPNHESHSQLYVPTSSTTMARMRSHRLNGAELGVQQYDKHEMGILGKIVKILTRDLLELEIMNSTMCMLFHVCGIVVSMFWNVHGEVHMLIV